eukprot:3010683-Rhodomonas_salina.1
MDFSTSCSQTWYQRRPALVPARVAARSSLVVFVSTSRPNPGLSCLSQYRCYQSWQLVVFLSTSSERHTLPRASKPNTRPAAATPAFGTAPHVRGQSARYSSHIARD